MIIDDIKKANITAMKAHDSASRVAFSEVISRYTLLKTSSKNPEVSDGDVLKIIQKVDKELDEEILSYQKAGREETVNELLLQKKALASFIPVMLSKEKIIDIISTLEDKSLPSIMKHFRENFPGQVDMALVSSIARGL